MPDTPTVTAMLAAAAEMGADRNREHWLSMLELRGETRQAYGYPADGPPLTMAEMKAGDVRNAELCAADVIVRHAGRRDIDECDYVRYWHGVRPTSNRDLPSFAHATVSAGCYTPAGARDLVADAWTQPEWPEGNYGAAFWRELFGQVGYLHRGRDEEDVLDPPAEVPTLWRGAIHSRRKGLAWTTDRDRAVWFAERFPADGSHYKTAHLWRIDGLDPARVLARFDNRGESEWVVDVRGKTPRREDTR